MHKRNKCNNLSVAVFFRLIHPLEQDPKVRPLIAQDTETLQRMLPEIPLWVKNPDYDRVGAYLQSVVDSKCCLYYSDHILFHS